ncbi:MAG: DUF2064 domain-containing protein [Lachnospiraceae bacterium]|jgi:rSAM/selenodomain-associated transferase 1|nr:DUF2064 domain-containing protein [Lachnospiraceae bacterium]
MNRNVEREALIIFTRLPVIGETKSRLIPFLGEEGACRLHEKIVAHTVSEGCEYGADIFVFYTGDIDRYERQEGTSLKEALIRDEDNLERISSFIMQPSGDLETRMRESFATVFSMNYSRILLLGTDIPTVSELDIRQGFANLHKHDMVINPVKDGGYYLIGFNFSFFNDKKEKFLNLWKIKSADDEGIYRNILRFAEDNGITYKTGRLLIDIDDKEDYLDVFGTAVTQASDCIHCGFCTDNCKFLDKYNMDLSDFAKEKDLAYHCFLCNDCRRVCPKNISGKAISLKNREELLGEKKEKLVSKVIDLETKTEEYNSKFEKKKLYNTFKMMIWEKSPYKFSSYRIVRKDINKGKLNSKNNSDDVINVNRDTLNNHYRKDNLHMAFFPGCNLTSVYPKTVNYLEKEFRKVGISTIYDCCQNPVHMLGLNKKTEVELGDLKLRLERSGIRELIIACPNCYYMFKNFGDIKVTSIYDKINELHIGQKIECDYLFQPCPDRKLNTILKSIEPFIANFEKTKVANNSCCGLGGGAGVFEKDLVASVNEDFKGKNLMTFCASCIGQMRRFKVDDANHVLPSILGIDENPVTFMPMLHRLKKKVGL